MLEKLNAKTILSKIGGLSFIIFLISIASPSMTFLLISLLVATLSILLFVLSLKQRNAKLYLIHRLGILTLLFFLGLRFWDISIGLSFLMLICLTPGLLFAGLLPFINSSFSERLYIAQWEMGTRNLLLLGILGLANVIYVLILWQLFGLVEVKQILFTPFVLIGFLFYDIYLLGIQSDINTYVSGRFQHWLAGNKGKAAR